MLNLFKHFKKDIKSKSDFGDFRFPSYTMYALYLRFICLQDIKKKLGTQVNIKIGIL